MIDIGEFDAEHALSPGCELLKSNNFSASSGEVEKIIRKLGANNDSKFAFIPHL